MSHLNSSEWSGQSGVPSHLDSKKMNVHMKVNINQFIIVSKIVLVEATIIAKTISYSK